MPTDDPVIAGHRQSSNHRDAILGSEECGCFFCGSIFKPDAIEEWVDEVDGVNTTALCPNCGIDSVIGSASGFPVTREFLQAMHRYWFA